MKIIFLDLDGVLNHEKFYTETFEKHKNNDVEWHERYFCPKTVLLLNKITDETSAKIVFSSSHRFYFETFEELKYNFKLAGITGELIGITPKLRFLGDTHSVPRGCEIKAWIEQNKGIIGEKVTKLKYAILDDDSDMLYWQRNSFFCTKGYAGLTEKISNKVIKHLNGK